VAQAGGLSESLTHEVRSLLWANGYLQAVKRVIQAAGLPLHDAVPVVDAEWARVRQVMPDRVVQRIRFLIMTGRIDEAANFLSQEVKIDPAESAVTVDDLKQGVKVRLTAEDVTALIPLLTAGNLIRVVDYVRSRTKVGARDAMFSLAVIIQGSGRYPETGPIPEKSIQVMRPIHASLRQDPVMSPEVRARVEIDFAREDWAAACRLLDLYGQESTDAGCTRVQLAVLKLAGGDPQKLAESVSDALRDYRDVLVWANA